MKYRFLVVVQEDVSQSGKRIYHAYDYNILDLKAIGADREEAIENFRKTAVDHIERCIRDKKDIIHHGNCEIIDIEL